METERPAEPAEEQSNAVGSLWGVLISPEKTFSGLSSRPAWVAALLALVLSAVALSIVITPKLDLRQQMREAIERRGGDLTPEQAERQIELASRFKWIGMASQVFLQPLFYLAMAGLLLVVFRLSGSEIDFRHSLSVTVHGMMPFALATILTLPAAFSHGTLTVQELQTGGLLPSNLAAFAPEGASKPLAALLSSFDLFSIWALILLAMGYRIVGRVSKATSWGVLLTMWAILTGCKIGLASIF
ncbi:MAG: YIP1 family protein [Thermoanaerobaculia bacterium]